MNFLHILLLLISFVAAFPSVGTSTGAMRWKIMNQYRHRNHHRIHRQNQRQLQNKTIMLNMTNFALGIQKVIETRHAAELKQEKQLNALKRQSDKYLP